MRDHVNGYKRTVLRRVLGPLANRWPAVETALRVQERFGELHGSYLAAAITLAGFTSIFPLLLLATAVLGWLSIRDANVAGEIISRLGLTETAATAVTSTISTAQDSRRIAGPLGAIGLLTAGLGLVAALQYAFDVVWQVTGRGIKDKLFGLVWLAGAAVLLAASFGLSALLNLAPATAPLAVGVGLLIDVALWLWTMRALTAVSVPWRSHLPGAVLGAIGLEVLKLVGAVYVPRVIGSSSALYGSIGVAFALLAWLFFFGRLTVYAGVLNVVRWEQRHGTITVEIELPRHPDVVTVEATRAGEARVGATT